MVLLSGVFHKHPHIHTQTQIVGRGIKKLNFYHMADSINMAIAMSVAVAPLHTVGLSAGLCVPIRHRLGIKVAFM